jgi:hypothetical protein
MIYSGLMIHSGFAPGYTESSDRVAVKIGAVLGSHGNEKSLITASGM